MGVTLHSAKQGGNAVAQNPQQAPWAYRVFQYGFALWTGVLFCLCLFAHNNPLLSLGRLQLAIVALLCAGLLAALFWCWERWVPVPRHPRRAAAVLFAVYSVLLVAFGLLMQVNTVANWDYPTVFNEACAFITDRAAPGSYFAICMNNAPLYWAYVGWLMLPHALGVQDLMSALVVLNCVCIVLSLFFLFRIAVRLWDEKRALFILCAAFLYPGLFLYAPIAYTDTLTLPFVTGAVLLWLRARDAGTAGEHPRALRLAVAALFLTALGSALKVSVAVLAVAFAIDLIFAWKGRIRWRALAASAACFLIVLFGGIELSHIGFPEYEREPFPLSHWIMMGLHGDGGYWNPDFELTLQYDTYEERVVFTREEIARRIAAMGPDGFVRHCANKLSYIYSDGTCYAPIKLYVGLGKPNPLHNWILPGARFSGFLYYAADGLQLCLLALCAWGSFCDARRGRSQLAFLRAAWFGLGLFLLLWEARSRYVVNFLPVFLLCAAAGLPQAVPTLAQKPAEEREGALVS